MVLSRLEKMISYEQYKVNKINRELESIGEGRLHMRNQNGKVYYREYINGGQHGITKDSNRIHQLARKDILNKELLVAHKNICALEKAYRTILEAKNRTETASDFERYQNLSKYKLTYSSEELRWHYNRQSHNPFNKDRLIYKTAGGVVTRSKSERFIGMFLESKNQIYMYEPEVIIDGKNVYPDFMLLRPDGKRVIWEHCGLMDNEEYFRKTMQKINEYRKIGYVQHNNLICTYEEDLQSTQTLEEILQRFIYN